MQDHTRDQSTTSTEKAPETAPMARHSSLRRWWRLLHSPVVLVPSWAACTGLSLADIGSSVDRFGWGGGAIIIVLVVLGAIVSLIDLLPHAVRWLVKLHEHASNALQRVGTKLHDLYEQVRTITSEH